MRTSQVLFVTTVILFSSTANAAVTSGYSRAAFQAAVAESPVLTLQNFDSFSAGSILTDDGSVTYGASTGSPLITSSFLTSTGSNGLGRTGVGFFLGLDSATFTFASAITAFAIDINTFATLAGSYNVLLSTGDVAASIFETFPARGTGQFIGLTSTDPFTSVVLSSVSFSYTLDTMIYGSSAPLEAAIPEAATWVTMIMGFGIVGRRLRRRDYGIVASNV